MKVRQVRKPDIVICQRTGLFKTFYCNPCGQLHCQKCCQTESHSDSFAIEAQQADKLKIMSKESLKQEAERVKQLNGQVKDLQALH